MVVFAQKNIENESYLLYQIDFSFIVFFSDFNVVEKAFTARLHSIIAEFLQDILL